MLTIFLSQSKDLLWRKFSVCKNHTCSKFCGKFNWFRMFLITTYNSRQKQFMTHKTLDKLNQDTLNPRQISSQQLNLRQHDPQHIKRKNQQNQDTSKPRQHKPRYKTKQNQNTRHSRQNRTKTHETYCSIWGYLERTWKPAWQCLKTVYEVTLKEHESLLDSIWSWRIVIIFLIFWSDWLNIMKLMHKIWS